MLNKELAARRPELARAVRRDAIILYVGVAAAAIIAVGGVVYLAAWFPLAKRWTPGAHGQVLRLVGRYVPFVARRGSRS